MEQQLELADIDAVKTATEFIKLFYEMMDKRRRTALKLYLETARLVWNGNSVSGSAEIVQFLEELPATDHTIQCLDSQALPDVCVGSQTTVVMTCGGNVRIDAAQSRPFTQTFVLTALDGKWKIVSDTFRYVELVT